MQCSLQNITTRSKTKDQCNFSVQINKKGMGFFMKNILFVASEGVPFIKTGGLADVVGSLPKYIDRRYFDVRVVLPKYRCMSQEMKDKMEYVTNFYMDFHWKREYVGIFKAEEDGVKYYFIDTEYYFNGSNRMGMIHFLKLRSLHSFPRRHFPFCR